MAERRAVVALVAALGIITFVATWMPARALAHGSFHFRLARVNAEIEREAGEAGLLLRRAALYRDHGDWQIALADVERAARLDPARADLDFHRGRIHLEAGRPALAETALARFLRDQPRHARAQVLRARALSDLERHAAAADAWARAIESEPVPVPAHHLERARALARAGDFEAALRCLDEALAVLGPLVIFEAEAVEIEVQRGRFDGALTRLDGVLRRSPRKEAWLARRGEILERASRNAEALEAYTQAEVAFESVSLHRRRTAAMARLQERLQAGRQRVESALATETSP